MEDSLSKDDKQAIKQAYFDEYNKGVRECTKGCDNGYIKINDNTVGYCDCVKYIKMKYEEFSNILKDDSIVAIDKDISYREFKKSNSLYSDEEEARECLDCGREFKTKLKCRARCPDCFTVYWKEFREALDAFFEEQGIEVKKREEKKPVDNEIDSMFTI